MSSAPTTRRFEFVVPGFTIVGIDAVSENAARLELWDEFNDTIALDHSIGDLELQTADFWAHAARLDKLDGVELDDSLPVAEFHIADIMRVAAGYLGEGWTAIVGPWAASGALRSDDAPEFAYELTPVKSGLVLTHEPSGLRQALEGGDDLRALALGVAEIVREAAVNRRGTAA
ncbi:hypothetical protein [Streptomyces sp. NPDC020965]|uniref:hypothetical protein n=1 Tax=Streptomyces sp. NPDC020965 TaxID=3365105 RepID=UPI0037A920A7